MPEGLLTAGGQVTGAVHDDPDHAPAPSGDAPRGWTWQRKDRKWAPRQRGPIVYQEDGDVPDRAPAADGGADPVVTGQDRDPDPSWAGDDEPRRDEPGKLAYKDVPRAVKDDIAGLAGLVGIPILSMLQQIDPYCGGVLAQAYEGVVDACLPLICRSQKVVRYFQADKSDWLLWGKLGIALKPFATAVLQHHVLRTVEVGRDEHGNAYVRPRNAGDQDQGDHLTPPRQYAA